MPKVSVIMPVYNVEDYVEPSMRSLLDQTERDIEIIAVNDGSADGSLEVLRGLADADDRIKVIDQKNAGPSAARNAGMTIATAPIIAFLDADDFFKPRACERIVELFAEHEADGIDVLTFGADCFPREFSTPWHEDKLHPRDAVYDPFAPDLLFKESSRPFHWRTAVRADFLRENGIVFDETLRLGEDQAFHFAIYPRAKRTVLVSDVLYEYRVSRADSAMGVILTDKAQMMAKHLHIADVILGDWRDAGFLNRYQAEMAAWIVEFAAYDILFLPMDQRTRLLAGVAELLRKYWTPAQLDALSVAPATRAILDAALAGKPVSDMRAKRLQLAYYKQQYGTRSMVRRLLRR